MKRIQRKRTKGWRMPENTIYVGRGSKWGNPLKLVGDQIFIHAGYRRKNLDPWVFLRIGNIEDLLFCYWLIVNGLSFESPDLRYWSDHFKRLDLNELKGHDLACWCPLSSPCHADVLIELLNDNRDG